MVLFPQDHGFLVLSRDIEKRLDVHQKLCFSHSGRLKLEELASCVLSFVNII